MNLDIYMRRLLSEVLKVCTGFSLLLTVKGKRSKKKERVREKEAELEDLGSSQTIHVANIRKLILERTPSVWLDDYSIRKSSTINHGANQPRRQKLGAGMGLYQQRHCPFGPKGTEAGF